MRSDQELIEEAHRQYRFYARWGKLSGVFLVVLALGWTALSCFAIFQVLNGGDHSGHRMATTLPKGAELKALIRNTTFLMGVATGALLMLSGVLGVMAAIQGLMIIARGNWRDALIVRLTDRKPDAE